ncbi:MAG: MAP7 domain-containing protein, partial [Candidatus Omnitrophota bacterium]
KALQEKLAREELERKQKEEQARKALQEKLAREELERKQKEDRDRYLDQCTILRGDCRLFVDTQNRCLRIYFKDEEITALGGINSIFFLPDLSQPCWRTVQDLPQPCWSIDKMNKNELLLVLDFTVLKQFWRLTFEQDNILTIKIAIELKTKISIVNRFVRLELSSQYNAWETSLEKGLFPDAQYVNNMSPVRLKDVRVSRIAASSSQEKLPRLIFEVTGENEQYVVGIFRQQQGSQEFSCLSFCPIISWVDRSLPEGKYDFFEGRIIFNSPEELEDKSRAKSRALISNQNLSFSFDRGQGNISWNGKILSNGLGVYTALRSQNIWYDSAQAAWKYIKKDKKHMVIEGRWPYIPIAQTWRFEVISENQVRWDIDMEIYDRVKIEIEQASIMLNEKYKKWFVEDLVKGDFLEEFTEDYDILPFRYWYGVVKNNGLAAGGKLLPKLIFTNIMPAQMSKGLLENSDYLYRSRILQYQRCNSQVLFPKKYSYFSGVIKIEAK